jgi:hypothetical protein
MIHDIYHTRKFKIMLVFINNQHNKLSNETLFSKSI